jgi:hypothetical protein
VRFGGKNKQSSLGEVYTFPPIANDAMDGAPEHFGLVGRTSNSKSKDEMRGFFPFGQLRVRMTNIFDG